MIDRIKEIIQKIQDAIKNLKENFLKVIQDFIDAIKNAIFGINEKYVEKIINDKINDEFGTGHGRSVQERKFIIFCIEDAKVEVEELVNKSIDIFKGCAKDGVQVGVGLVDETKALIKQSLDLVGHCTLEFGKCLFDVLHYDKCFKEAIADCTQRANDIKTAGDQLGEDIKNDVTQGAEAFRLCWRGGYDAIEDGTKQIIQNIKDCAGITS